MNHSYKKIDCGLFQLESFFIAGLLFFRDGDEFKEFDNQYEIAARFIDGNVYKKIPSRFKSGDKIEYSCSCDFKGVANARYAGFDSSLGVHIVDNDTSKSLHHANTENIKLALKI